MVYYTLAAVVSSTLYFVVFIPSNVVIRMPQRRIHADARRLGQRSSSGFPPLSLTRVSFEPGTSAVTPGCRTGDLQPRFSHLNQYDGFVIRNLFGAITVTVPVSLLLGGGIAGRRWRTTPLTP